MRQKKSKPARQFVLKNLITRVGGKKNIRKWMDELIEIDNQLEIEFLADCITDPELLGIDF